MAEFEDSKIYKVAKVTYEAASFFKSKATRMKESLSNEYTATSIEAVKRVRSAVRGVKDGLTSLGYSVKNKVEDKMFDAKEFGDKAKQKAISAKDTVHYYALVGKDKAKDKLDTIHYGALVANDKVVKPVTKVAAKAFKNMSIAGKAGLNVGAMGLGLAAAGVAKGYDAGAKYAQQKAEQFKAGARKLQGMAQGKVAGIKAKLGQMNEARKEQGNKISGWFKQIGGKATSVLESAKNTVTHVAVEKINGAKDFTNKAINTGMFMGGVAMEAGKKKWNSITKVAGEKASMFKANATKRIIGGRNFAKNVVNRISNGGKGALASVGNTLSSVRNDLNKGIAASKVAIKAQARGNMVAWARLGAMKAKGGMNS